MPGVQSQSAQTADQIFESYIKERLPNNPQLVELGGVYQFNLLRNGQVIRTLTLDVPNKSLHSGCPPDLSPIAVISLEEPDAMQALNDHNALKTLFIKRKLRITGTRVALEKLQQLWVELASTKTQIMASRVKDQQQTDDKSVGGVDDNEWLNLIPKTGIKSDVLFFALKSRLPEEKAIVSQLQGVLQYNITIDEQLKTVWTMDFTQPIDQIVYSGAAKSRPDCVVNISDDEFLRLMLNKLNPQKGFMMGRVKVAGNIMMVYKLFTVWIDHAFRKGRGPELKYIADLILDNPILTGLRSEAIVCELIQRLVRKSTAYAGVGGVYFIDVTRDGQVMSKWKLDFSSDPNCGVFSRQPLDSQSQVERCLVIDDDDFARLVFNRTTIEKLLSSGRAKTDPQLIANLKKIFAIPTVSKL